MLDLELGALELNPSHLMAPAGPITLRITNTDSMVHNLSVAGASIADLQPGATTEQPAQTADPDPANWRKWVDVFSSGE